MSCIPAIGMLNEQKRQLDKEEHVGMAGRIGKQLGNYRLLRLLGQGGFAQVYLGEHVYLMTKVAIKILQAQLADHSLEDFLNEARMIASLEHPHIIRVLDFGVEGSTPFLVMDYAPNGTLRTHHRSGISLSPQSILPYVKQVAAALEYAHKKKLVHRDVKPENMLLGVNNELLLSDFGIALMTHSSHHQTTSEQFGGTIPYMAPEQLQGKPQPASDQYALGVVVYEWLCGERPFRGSFIELASQHMLAVPPSLREKVPTISSDVEVVVLKALAKDPQQRFARVQDFADALVQACRPGYSRLFVSPVALPPSQSPHTDFAASPPDPLCPSTILPGMSPKLLGKPQPLKRGLSRRMILSSLGGAVVAGGGAIWFAYFYPFSSAIAQGALIYTYDGHSGSVNGVVWSPDGKRLASASADKTVQIWDAITGSHAFTLRGHSDSVNAIAWSSDGKRLASASTDKTVQIWNAVTGSHISTYHGHSDEVYTLSWSPDGTRIASGGKDGTVQIWQTTTEHNFRTYLGHSGHSVFSVVWSPDGQYIASGSADQSVQVWTPTTGVTNYTYRSHRADVWSVAWSRDGQYIASGSHDQTVQIWTPTTGVSLLTYHHNAPVNAVAWSPDGERIASASLDDTVQVRQVR